MNTRQFDLYTNIHKALRNMLFKFSFHVGMTDFYDAISVNALYTEFKSLIEMLSDHVAHEKESIILILNEKLPDEATRLNMKYSEQEAEIEKLESYFYKIQSSFTNFEQRQQIGLEFYKALNRFIAHHLEHIDEEEERVVPVLEELCTETELTGIMDDVISNVDKQKIAEAFKWEYPLATIEERENLIMVMRHNVPPGIFLG